METHQDSKKLGYDSKELDNSSKESGQRSMALKRRADKIERTEKKARTEYHLEPTGNYSGITEKKGIYQFLDNRK
jgi:hypothetical protein